MRTSSKRGEVIKDRLKKYGEEDGLENLCKKKKMD